ncbi:MAG TPA: bifunctional riboflavin kinase/FAD synthetase [Acidimicrobiales bacterium]|nr:bifunctional riboflavin kinase/FAD synthetase [Acidimicrobiales bacterium]
MKVAHYPDECLAPPNGSVVTIGAFDGVHLGHRRLIERVRRTANEIGAQSCVVTFDRHPASVVRPESAPLLLTDLDQKLSLLAACGIDLTLVVRFDAERASEPAEEFVAEVLVGCLNARAVVVGHDFHFGRHREGDVPLLQRMGARMGFDVTGIRLAGIPLAGPDGPSDAGGGQGPGIGAAIGTGEHAGVSGPISSTRIRQLVAEGDVRRAAALLGRWYELRGVVGHGEKRGRELGFPTANLEVRKEMQLCADGVYAGWYLRPDGTRHQTAISVGRQPTFYESRPYSLVEAHLLDFQGDLYDEVGTVEFVSRLRGQERFASVEALVDQMSSDVAQTRRALAMPSPWSQ